MPLYTTTATVSGLTPADYGPLITEPMRRASVAMQVATVAATGSTHFHVPVLRQDAGSAFVAEGAEIAEQDAVIDEITVTPAKVAALNIVSRELATDSSPAAAQVVGDSMAQSLANTTDAAFFGALAAPAPSGLESLTTTATAGTVGTAIGNLDVFAEAISLVQQDGAEVTAFCLNPTDWLHVAQLKVGDSYNVPLLGTDAAAGTARTVLGIPAMVSKHVTAGTCWALAQPRVMVIQREDVTLDIDSSAYFSSDRVGVRATMRRVRLPRTRLHRQDRRRLAPGPLANLPCIATTRVRREPAVASASRRGRHHGGIPRPPVSGRIPDRIAPRILRTAPDRFRSSERYGGHMRYPAGLARDGRALWRELAETYEFTSPGERSAAVEACRLSDELASLRAQLAEDGRAFVRGSQGQDVANPLREEVRRHSKLVRDTLASIRVEQPSAETRSEAARRAVRARWDRTA